MSNKADEVTDETTLTEETTEDNDEKKEGREKKSEDATDEQDTDAELEALKKRVKEMEEEDEKLRKMQDELESSQDLGANKDEVDARSVYVGNVDYSTTPQELQAHFQACGTINRVTILCDKWTGHPKGFAYVEFEEKDSVANALLLNETLFKGRQLKVVAKRTNVPGMNRGRGPRGGGGYFRPYFAPRRFLRGRRGYFHPYA